MDPFRMPVNVQPQIVPLSGATATETDVPGLDPIREKGRGARPAPDISKPPTRGAAALAQKDTLDKLLVPVAAAAGALYKPESFFGQKAMTFLTGFKVGEAGALANKFTPGALLFLGPEPIGMLPERFFMKKPQIPGTNIYLDPLHNAAKYLERRDQRKRSDAGEAQLAALQELLPQLTIDQLYTLRLDRSLQRRHIGFADPRAVEDAIHQEIEARRVVQHQADAIALGQQRGAESLVALLFVTGVSLNAVSGAPNVTAAIGDLFPSVAGNLSVLSASIQPELIEPVNDAARRNRDRARGIRRDLVHERADP